MKNMNRMFVVAIAGVMITSGCSKENLDSISHSVALQFGSYTAADNRPFLMKLLVPKAQASISSLKFCFKRLRFKLDDTGTAAPETSNDNIDFSLGEVDISSGVTSLGTIELPEGTYKRIEFDLEPDCASGKSMQITNSNGTYSSTSRITIKFSGSFTADSDGALTLGVQTIIDQLNAYNGVGVLKDVSEAVGGQLTE